MVFNVHAKRRAKRIYVQYVHCAVYMPVRLVVVEFFVVVVAVVAMMVLAMLLLLLRMKTKNSNNNSDELIGPAQQVNYA